MDTKKIRELSKQINNAEDMLTGVMVNLPDDFETPKRWLHSAINRLIDVQINLNGTCYWLEKDRENGSTR